MREANSDLSRQLMSFSEPSRLSLFFLSQKKILHLCEIECCNIQATNVSAKAAVAAADVDV